MAAESKDDAAPVPASAAAVAAAAAMAAADETIAAASAVAKAGELGAAIDRLYAAEKKARMAGDALVTAKLCVGLLRLCYEAGDWKAVLAHLQVLSKRRGQSKQAISDMVAEAMTYVDKAPGKEEKTELIVTLRGVTEGKMYVEVERARLTRQLAAMHEAEGRIAEASEVLQEVAVETSAVMEMAEKADFILEQVRLTQAQGDFVRMGIIANKVNKKVLDDPGYEALRLRYYNLLVALHQHQHDALALCKDYQAIAATRGYEADAAKWGPPLQSAILYCALAPWSNEVSDILHKLKADKRTEELGSYRSLLLLMTTAEIVSWPLPAPHHTVLMTDHAFTTATPGAVRAAGAGAGAGAGAAGDGDIVMAGAAGSTAAARSSAASRPTISVTRREDEDRVGWADIMRKRVLQHNIRVVAKWYGRVRCARFAALLGVDEATAEAAVSELAADKALYAKIDRPAGIITFVRTRPATEVVADYGADIDAVLGLVEKTRHLIEKEYMVRGITVAAGSGAGAGAAPVASRA